LPDQLWEKLHLRTNAFDIDEVDVEDPIAFHSLSVGEEISSSEVVALQWSPQGLAKHGRCALAVLTQNLALSIWGPTAQPRSLAGWKRLLVINRVLQRYFTALYPEEKRSPDQDRSERLKRLQRIRAFTWSPPALLIPFAERHPYAGSESCKGNFLAVSNDNNEVILIRLASFMRMASSLEDIEKAVSVVARFSIMPGDATLPNLSWSFEDYANNQSYVAKLAWSPWIDAEDASLVAVIVCATRSRLEFRRVRASTTPNGLKVHTETFESNVILTTPWSPGGILRWLPLEDQEANLKLLAFTGGNVLIYDVNALEGSVRTLAKHTRDDWDSVAGTLTIKIWFSSLSPSFLSQISAKVNILMLARLFYHCTKPEW
jgi:hypothetical protein